MVGDRAEHLTVIIPAWNCAGNIDRSLTALAGQTRSGAGTSIIVAVNDGKTESVDAAERHRSALEAKGYRFDVIETEQGRRAAIQAAEAMAARGAFVYLDHDASLSPGALEAFAKAVASPDTPRFVAFRLCFSHSPSAVVRAFISAWSSLPYFTASPVTAGAFGVSEAGRKRWGTTLPPVASDDKFVRLCFAPGERIFIGEESYEIWAPQTISELVRSRARYIRGNRELERLLGSRPRADCPRYKGWYKLLRRPDHFAVVVLTTTASSLASFSDRAVRFFVPRT